jgi:hypothetical protein
VPAALKNVGASSLKSAPTKATHVKSAPRACDVAGASVPPKPRAPLGTIMSKTASTVTAPRAGVFKINVGAKRPAMAPSPATKGKQARVDVRLPPTSTATRKAPVRPQAPGRSDDGLVACCVLLDFVPSVESCSSSSSSDSSGSESVLASPPSVPDLHISAELPDMTEVL